MSLQDIANKTTSDIAKALKMPLDKLEPLTQVKQIVFDALERAVKEYGAQSQEETVEEGPLEPTEEETESASGEKYALAQAAAALMSVKETVKTMTDRDDSVLDDFVCGYVAGVFKPVSSQVNDALKSVKQALK